jgi:hypothetical protein
MDENDYIYLLLAFILGYFANSIIKQMCGQNIEGFDGPDGPDEQVYCDPSPPKICEISEGKPITCENDSDCSCENPEIKNRRKCQQAVRSGKVGNFGRCISGPQPMCPGGTPCPACGTNRCLCPSPPPSEEIVDGQPGCVPGQTCDDGSECPPNGLCPVPCAGLKDNREKGRISCDEGTTLKENTFYNTSSPQEQQASCCVQSCETSTNGGSLCPTGATLVNNAHAKYPKGYGVNGGCCEYLNTPEDAQSLHKLLKSPNYKCGSSPGEACVRCGNKNNADNCPLEEDWTRRWKQHQHFLKDNLLTYYQEDDSPYGTLCGIDSKKDIRNCSGIGGNYRCETISTERKSSGTRGKKCAISQ